MTTDGSGAPHATAPDWTSFGIRKMATMSARTRVENPPPFVQAIVDERAACLTQPFTGLTDDGRVRAGLRTRRGGKTLDTTPITESALAFLQALTSEQRARATLTMDAVDWRTWINVHMNHFRHGVMLEDLDAPTRELGLGILRATLSARGFQQARTIMRINEIVAELSGDHEAFGEWPYFMSIFGSPEIGSDEPWGWQIDGHHLCVNCAVFNDRAVMTPTFMGSEPRHFRTGPLAGTTMFDPEERLGLDLIRALDVDQRERAIVYRSIMPGDIPEVLQNPFDGRMQAGAFHDNIVLPYQGVPGRDLSDAQRGVLRSIVATYLGWQAEPHASVSLDEVAAHLAETWFSWYGGYDDVAPFYYRVHSPLILIEFDHHPGVVFDNAMPTRHHVHTVVRTPNGGDYGRDLLAEHYARHPHRHVGHTSDG